MYCLLGKAVALLYTHVICSGSLRRSIMYRMGIILFAAVASLSAMAEEATYAERLGWPEGSRVLILHADDLGLSLASNEASIATIEAGPVTSVSIMMVCPWVPHFVDWLREHPKVDAGLHLTMTSEWGPFRWAPAAGRNAVPGLVDPRGYMHDSVRDVVKHATPDEVEKEIRAQIAQAERLGINVTHIDSHMGALYASPAFFERYMKVAIEKGLPFLIAGGHLTKARENEGDDVVDALQQVVPVVWEAGLPVLDDIDTSTYAWDGLDKTGRFVEAIRTLKPGVTWLNVHPTMPTHEAKIITGNREKLFGDYHGLVDPKVMAALNEEGIILTTWKELKERRANVAGK
jgi:predicted glycoside hydrolase/deacetylase ChbG (UPF0249 family)